MTDSSKRISERVVDVEQVGLRKGRGCFDQIFALPQVVERVLEKNWVYSSSGDIEKAFDQVSRKVLWEDLTQ